MLEKPKFESKDFQERELLEKVSRREFLNKLTKGMIVLGLGSIESVLSSGCAIKKIGLENEKIKKGLEKFQEKIEDPNNYLKYLKEREFIIKNEIFDSYSQTVDKRPVWLGVPVGGYISENYLNTKERQKEFRERLNKLRLSKEAIEFYESLFSSSDIIIFRESILKDEFFLKALPHERFHRAIKKITNEEYKLMKETAQEIINTKDENDNFILRERDYKGKMNLGFYTAAATLNWEEFYTYLAQGEFDEEIEKILKTKYPDAYKIFDKIRNDCKLIIEEDK